MTVFYMYGFSVFPWNSPGKKIIQVSTLKCSALHCHCRRRQPLVSLSSARKEEPGDAAANQKTCYSQHSSKPCWHITCGCHLCRRWNGEAVRHCEDVRMLLEHTHISQGLHLSHTHLHEPFMPSCTYCTDESQLGFLGKWVWQLSYLSGALDGLSGLCEIVIGLFFTHWLQLEVKQRKSLSSSWLNISLMWHNPCPEVTL